MLLLIYMKLFSNQFHAEIRHFHILSIQERKLLFSIAIYNIIYPIFAIFINAFLWRQTHDLTLIAVYNILLYTGLPLGFYLNGLLLRRSSPNVLYFLGLALSGIIVAILIFLPTDHYDSVSIFGLINGIATGIFWANRNFLTLETTKSSDRIYFSSIESVTDIITSILVPVAIGFFIIYGSTVNLYTPIVGYKMLSIIMLLIIVFIGKIIMSFTLQTTPTKQITLTKISKTWKLVRFLQLTEGLTDILRLFLPTIIILYLLGNEQTLGIFQSLLATIAALVLYIITRSLKTKYRVSMLTACFVLTVIGTFAFSKYYSSMTGIFIFFACLAIAMPLLWIATRSLTYDVIDKETKHKSNHFAYIFDMELYINLGRIIAITGFVFMLHFFSNETALRFLPLMLATLQICLIVTAQSIEKALKQ